MALLLVPFVARVLAVQLLQKLWFLQLLLRLSRLQPEKHQALRQ
jgi:hypothetical protein